MISQADPAARMVLVAVDREQSPALSVAAGLARLGHGRLTVLACRKEPPVITWCDPTARVFLQDDLEGAESFLCRMLQSVPRDVPVTGCLRRTSVSRALLVEARERNYDTLVIEVKDRGRLARDRRGRMLLRGGWPGRVVVVPDRSAQPRSVRAETSSR